MQVGVIGAGRIGATAAALFARAGHQVAIGNSRGPDSLADLAAALGPHVHAADVRQAAAFGEVVLLAIPLGAYRSLPPEAFAGKIVVDAMNHHLPRDTAIDLAGRPSTELVARWLPGARVVKSFNTLAFTTLADGGRPDAETADRLGLPMAGDDAGAKAVVARLIEDLGYAAVDVGGLAEGGRPRQAVPHAYNSLLTPAEARSLLAEQG